MASAADRTTASLRIKEARFRRSAMTYARWRDPRDGRQVERRLGRGWLAWLAKRAVRLFDGFRISVDDRLVTTVDAPWLQSLLAYLVLHAVNPQIGSTPKRPR